VNVLARQYAIEMRQQRFECGLPQHVRHVASDDLLERAAKPVRIRLVRPEIAEITAAACHRDRHLFRNKIERLETRTLAILNCPCRVHVLYLRDDRPIGIASNLLTARSNGGAFYALQRAPPTRRTTNIGKDG
jgi:hypothetical protein